MAKINDQANVINGQPLIQSILFNIWYWFFKPMLMVSTILGTFSNGHNSLNRHQQKKKVKKILKISRKKRKVFYFLLLSLNCQDIAISLKSWIYNRPSQNINSNSFQLIFKLSALNRVYLKTITCSNRTIMYQEFPLLRIGVNTHTLVLSLYTTHYQFFLWRYY